METGGRCLQVNEQLTELANTASQQLTLTGLVEVLGRLSSPLQPGGVEVAPFVLGFISTAAGASRRRRRRRRRLRREPGRRFGLPLVQAEQPRHVPLGVTEAECGSGPVSERNAAAAVD